MQRSAHNRLYISLTICFRTCSLAHVKIQREYQKTHLQLAVSCKGIYNIAYNKGQEFASKHSTLYIGNLWLGCISHILTRSGFTGDEGAATLLRGHMETIYSKNNRKKCYRLTDQEQKKIVSIIHKTHQKFSGGNTADSFQLGDRRDPDPREEMRRDREGWDKREKEDE